MATTGQHGIENKKSGNDHVTVPASDPEISDIDRAAPAGSENSLGAQSVRDGRPSTDDSVVEAIDEQTPS